MMSDKRICDMQLEIEQLETRIKRIQLRRQELEAQANQTGPDKPATGSLAEELARAALQQGWSREDVRKAFGV